MVLWMAISQTQRAGVEASGKRRSKGRVRFFPVAKSSLPCYSNLRLLVARNTKCTQYRRFFPLEIGRPVGLFGVAKFTRKGCSGRIESDLILKSVNITWGRWWPSMTLSTCNETIERRCRHGEGLIVFVSSRCFDLYALWPIYQTGLSCNMWPDLSSNFYIDLLGLTDTWFDASLEGNRWCVSLSSSINR